MEVKLQTEWDAGESNDEFLRFLKSQERTMILLGSNDLTSQVSGQFLFRNASEKSVYWVLTSYFKYTAAPDAAISVTNMDPNNIGFITIVADQYRDIATETANMYSQSELLSSEQVFFSIWPNVLLQAAQEDDVEDAEEGEIETVVLEKNRTNIFDGLFGEKTTIREEVSFFVYDSSMEAVMDVIVSVAAYDREGDEFFRSEVTPIDSDIVVTTFETSLGDAVDLRVPLPKANKAEAILRLSQKLQNIDAKIYYIVDESEFGDELVAQQILNAGQLGSPEKITMGY